MKKPTEIRLRSGRYLDLADPHPDMFTFEDIAGALSKICRFGGQCRYFYSVAEHSVHCADQGRRVGLPSEDLRALLMHDAAEAFVGDVTRPLKRMIRDYDQIEGDVALAIADKFDIDWAVSREAVKKIDDQLLKAERKVLFTSDGVEWQSGVGVEDVEVQLELWQPEQTEAQFWRAAVALDINVEI